MFANIINRELSPANSIGEHGTINQLIDHAFRTNDVDAINAALRTAARAKAVSRVDCSDNNDNGQTLDEKMREMSHTGMRLHTDREPRPIAA